MSTAPVQNDWETGVALLAHEYPGAQLRGVYRIERALLADPFLRADADRILTDFVATHRRRWRPSGEAVGAAKRVLLRRRARSPWPWRPLLRWLRPEGPMEWALVAAFGLVTCLLIAAALAAAL